MSDTHEQTSNASQRADDLTALFASGITIWLRLFELFALPEALLIGSTVAYTLRYFIPPKPRTSFARWMIEHIAFIVCFYLAFFKIPLLLKRVVNFYLAYGISIAVFLLCYFAWLGYSAKFFRPRRA